MSDRLLCGLGSLFLSPGRIEKLAIALRPSTLLAFHRALVRRKYRRGEGLPDVAMKHAALQSAAIPLNT